MVLSSEQYAILNSQSTIVMLFSRPVSSSAVTSVDCATGCITVNMYRFSSVLKTPGHTSAAVGPRRARGPTAADVGIEGLCARWVETWEERRGDATVMYVSSCVCAALYLSHLAG